MKRSRTTIIGIACGLACAACVFAYAQGVRGEADAARAEALRAPQGSMSWTQNGTHDNPTQQSHVVGANGHP